MATKQPLIFAEGIATFYCRKYVRGMAYAQSPMAAEGERITLVMTCRVENTPDTLKTYLNDQSVCKQRTADDGANLASFSFKVGKFCKFYDKTTNEAIDKPTNEYLEGRRYDVELAFNYAAKTSDPLSPSGFWLNGVRMQEHQSNYNPFGDRTEQPTPQTAQPVAPQPQTQTQVLGSTSEGEKKKELPF